MTAKEAAEAVLRDAGEALDVHEITRRILQDGLWHPTGKTPRATVEAQLCVNIKKRGAASPFVRVAPRTYGLRAFGAKPIRIKRGGHRATLSFTNAAEKMLEQFAKKQPMHYRAITKKALDLDLLSTGGKTPEATMYAQILQEIKRRTKRGEQPRFVQHGRGYVGLSKWMGTGLAFEIQQHNRHVRQQLRKRIMNVTPDQFEELIGQLLAAVGFEEIEVTSKSNDGGIDVRGTLVVGDVIRTRMAIQAKKWKKGRNVHSPVVQQVRGSLGAHEQGLIITTSDFSPGARTEAMRSDAVPVGLMNGEQLVALLVESEIGILRKPHTLLELAEETTSE